MGRLFEAKGFFDSGPLASLRWSSRKKLTQSYGHWLSFLLKTNLLVDEEPWKRVTVESVSRYISYEKSRVSARTVYEHISDLLWVTSSMAPDLDWSWLERVTDKLRANANMWRIKPRRVTTAGQIFSWAIQRMQETDVPGGFSDVSRAVDFRDGLMLAVLISVPLRVRAFTGIMIGKHLTFNA